MDRFDPYAAPAGVPTQAAASGTLLGWNAKVTLCSFVAGVVGSAVVGSLWVVANATSFEFFGATVLVADVVALATVRSYGPDGAFLVTCLITEALAHGRPHEEALAPDEARGSRWQHALNVAALAPVTTMGIVGAALVTLSVGYAVPALQAVRSALEILRVNDVLYWAGITAAYAIAAAIVLPWALRRLSPTRATRSAKLTIALFGSLACILVGHLTLPALLCFL